MADHLMSRYLVVTLPDTLNDLASYIVVDTDTTGGSTGTVVCPATCHANAHLVADALNGQYVADLMAAKRALVTIHRFIEHQLDPDPSPDWGAYYTATDEIEFVNQVQHDHEEPF